MNKKNYEKFVYYYDKHVKEHGKMPVEAALTNLVHNCILNKNYKFHTGNSDNNYQEYDVIGYANLANDVFFGVITDINSNVLTISTGTAKGTLTKTLET